MNIESANIIQELNELLEESEEANECLRCELEGTKTDLIIALEKLGKYQEKHIELLEDARCDCPMCNQ